MPVIRSAAQKRLLGHTPRRFAAPAVVSLASALQPDVLATMHQAAERPRSRPGRPPVTCVQNTRRVPGTDVVDPQLVARSDTFAVGTVSSNLVKRRGRGDDPPCLVPRGSDGRLKAASNCVTADLAWCLGGS